MPHDGISELCLPGPPTTNTWMLSGCAGHRQQVVGRDELHPLRPRALLEVPVEHARRHARRGRTGTTRCRQRVSPCAANVRACSGPSPRKNSPMLMHALFIPSDVIAEAILSRISAGSPSASMSCTLCGPSPQCTVTALGASTPRLARIRLPRALVEVLGDAVRVLRRLALASTRRRSRAARRRRGASSGGRRDRRWRWRGCRGRTRRRRS